jgi:hypothetical protein
LDRQAMRRVYAATSPTSLWGRVVWRIEAGEY